MSELSEQELQECYESMTTEGLVYTVEKICEHIRSVTADRDDCKREQAYAQSQWAKWKGEARDAEGRLRTAKYELSVALGQRDERDAFIAELQRTIETYRKMHNERYSDERAQINPHPSITIAGVKDT
jgi:chromosome segregation ATPase